MRARFQKWVDEDVRWIITDQERTAFQELKTDQQRDEFVDAFWARRDPTPGTPENEFEEEHYRRIAFSNVHFKGKVAGWKTDRGRVYIVYGPPDEVESHASRPPQGELLPTNTASHPNDPYEVWHYRNIKGDNRDITVRFVDKCRCGDYQRQIDASEKVLP